MRFKVLWPMLGWFMLITLGGCTQAAPVSTLTPEPALDQVTVDAGATRPSVTRPAGAEDNVLPTSESTPRATIDPDIRATAPLPPGAERVTPTLISQPVIGEVPPSLIEAMMDDLVSQTSVDPNSIQIIRAESVIWNDGSLGCPQPDMVYTQALVKGYHVVLATGGNTYDYHAAESGYFLQCQYALPQLSTPDR